MYMKGCTTQNYGAKKQIDGCLVPGGMGMINCKGLDGNLGVIKMFYTMIVLVVRWLDMLSTLIKW